MSPAATCMHVPPASSPDRVNLVTLVANCALCSRGRAHSEVANGGSQRAEPQGACTMQCSVTRPTAALAGVSVQGPGPAKRRAARCGAAQAEAATQRLTKDDLVSYLASGCRPREEWR